MFIWLGGATHNFAEYENPRETARTDSSRRRIRNQRDVNLPFDGAGACPKHKRARSTHHRQSASSLRPRCSSTSASCLPAILPALPGNSEPVRASLDSIILIPVQKFRVPPTLSFLSFTYFLTTHLISFHTIIFFPHICFLSTHLIPSHQLNSTPPIYLLSEIFIHFHQFNSFSP